ncbi:hypothetical protein NDU88_004291 [Pleurodeles waltl]|uniref:Uncharacterized protein n=1 Tax=Pleurodeles waltl TaxID=8319 RepID=A0AAV7VGN1_PLEWA|nr:hypothetical protein NDU88_004291 [Pleurodeles waltl]
MSAQSHRCDLGSLSDQNLSTLETRYSGCASVRVSKDRSCREFLSPHGVKRAEGGTPWGQADTNCGAVSPSPPRKGLK